MNDASDARAHRNTIRAVETVEAAKSDEPALLPVYDGLGLDEISLVTSEAMAREAFEALLAADVIGFDSESKPTFRKGEASSGPHLIQLATDTRAYLFPIVDWRYREGLKTILEASRPLKAGFGLGNDRSALKARLDIAWHQVVDLGEELRGPHHKGTVGARTAVALLFGKTLRKSKKIGTSNWASPQLTAPQLLYAANDAHVALRIYREWVRRGCRYEGSVAAGS